MYGIVNKILGVILCLALAVLMLANVMVADQLQARRSIVGEVTNFVDEITDTGYLDEKGLQDLYLGCNSYGPTCNVTVIRYARVIQPDPTHPGSTYTTYTVSDNIYKWNQGDICKVSVDEVGYTSLSYFLYMTLHLTLQPVDFNLAGRIRK